MAIQTVRPTVASGVGGWTIVGGGTFHGSLDDDPVDTATRIESPAGNVAFAEFQMGSYTLAADERVAQFRARIHVAMRAGATTLAGAEVYADARPDVVTADSQIASASANLSTTVLTYADKSTPWKVFSTGPQQESIDNLECILIPLAHDRVAIAELYVDLDVWQAAEALELTVRNTPGGSSTATVDETDQPWLALTTPTGHLRGDGVPGTWARQVRVWTAADVAAGGFDPAATTAEWSNDTTSASGPPPPDVTTIVQTGPLTNDTDYVGHVRWGKTGVSGETLWSPWATVEFTVDLVLPDPPNVKVTVEPSGANRVVVTPDDLTYDSAVSILIERSEDNFESWQTIRGGNIPVTSIDPVTVDDYDAHRGIGVVYRASVTEATAGGSTLASVPNEALSVVRNLDGAVQIMTVPDFDTVLLDAPAVAGQQATIGETLGVFRSPWRPLAVVTTSGVVHGDDHNLQLDADDVDVDDVNVLARHAGPLLVKWADGEQHYLRPSGDRQLTRADVGYQRRRVWQIPCVEVDGNTG